MPSHRPRARHLDRRLWPALGLSLLLGAPAWAEGSHKPAHTASPRVPADATPAASRSGSPAADAARAVPVAEPSGNRQVAALEAGAGRIIQLPGPAANVFVADPKVAEVRPASTNTLFVFGVGPGRTTVAAMDAEGHAIAQIELTVRPSTFAAVEAEGVVARLMPNSRIRVTPQAHGLLLTGSVDSPAEAARAASILRGYMQKDDTIENQLAVQSSIQVNLRVRILEMNRSVTRSLGVDWATVGSIGRTAVLGTTTTGIANALTPAGSLILSHGDVGAVINALAQDNLVHVLAEPNLTVMSGQPGSFLVGGEYPVPVGQQNGTITIEFKKYGVNLAVVPTVLSDGRINLHVSPEVSQLTDQGAVKLVSANTSLSVPALTVRRAETTVELGSGQSFAVAGLLQDQSTQASNGVPLLGELPIIGQLFRSTSFQRQETELVILMTPYVVRPTDNPAALHGPDDGFQPPTDLERILLLRQVSTSGAAQPASQAGATPAVLGAGGRIPGAAGFIVQ